MAGAPSAGRGRPAAFLDRDGVINEDLGWVHRIEDFRLLPGAVEGMRLLARAGLRLVVVTNQAGIARGLYDEDRYLALTRHMRGLLEREGVTLDAVYHCPHHPTAGRGALRRACGCRKPAPGMLLRARDELGIDLSASVLVGDKQSDLQAGRAAGVGRLALVGPREAAERVEDGPACIVCADLLEAARRLVADGRRPA